MLLLSTALSFSMVKALHLNNCNIDDDALMSLGLRISEHQYLRVLSISLNPITLAGFKRFLTDFICNENSQLTTIETDLVISTELKTQIEQINNKRRWLYPLEIFSLYREQEVMKDVFGILYLYSLPAALLSRKHKDN